MQQRVAKAEKLITRNFLLIWLTTLITFTAFTLLLPTLPMYVLQLGGHEADVGLVIGVITVTSVSLRPIMGAQMDRRGRWGIMLAGQAGLLVCLILYNFAHSMPALIALRLVHGVAWAASTTSLTTLIADIAPPARRGEAMGYYGMASNLAMAVAPALAIAIVTNYSFTSLFLTSSVLALVALGAAWPISETRGSQNRTPPVEVSRESSSPGTSGLFPSFIMFLITISYGSMISFLPLYARNFQVDNAGLFFAVYALVVILSRPLSGRLSDRYGRAAVILPGIALIAASMVALSLSGALPVLLLVGLLYGLGMGAAQPTLMALSVDRVAPRQRGKAMGYFTGAFDLGIGAGAIVMGFTIQFVGFSNMFLVAAFVAGLGLVTLALKERGSIL